jgi:hypothetical protein
VASALAGMIWPQRSLIAHRELAGPGALEPELWSRLCVMSEPLCRRHGMQFGIAAEPLQVCAAFIADPPTLAGFRVRSGSGAAGWCWSSAGASLWCTM